MDPMAHFNISRLLLLLGFTLLAPSFVFSQHIHEKAPILYSESNGDNCVTKLQAKIDSGDTVLKHDEHFGYLPAVLEALDVPVSSQGLVFSKTSLQVTKISPRTPRAIYFGDDIYVGWVQNSNFMELSAVDPKLGTVFYSLKHANDKRPQFQREGATCLACHATSHTGYVPGHVVFSVYSDAHGSPVAGAGFSSTDHTSSFRGRWGGWFVTGEHGEQRHRGNTTMKVFDTPQRFNYDKGANRTKLSELVDVEPYLSPHSDLVALMVLEHQVLVHNRLTAASYHGQIVEDLENHEDEAANDGKEDALLEVARQQRDRAIDRLVDSLLMAREATLSEPIRGTSVFAKEFSERGSHDSQGRGLRQLDLQSRLFRYPCSFLIYGVAFDGLPQAVRLQTYAKMRDVLTSDESSFKYRHVTRADRKAIMEILRDTKPELAKAWPDKK